MCIVTKTCLILHNLVICHESAIGDPILRQPRFDKSNSLGPLQQALAAHDPLCGSQHELNEGRRLQRALVDRCWAKSGR